MYIDVYRLMQKATEQDILQRKIDRVVDGLAKEYHRRLNEISEHNISILCDYVLAVRTESSLSDSYRTTIINVISYMSKYLNNMPFKSIQRDDLLLFLEHFRKTEKNDPMHKWVGTYNLYLTVISKFFRWLYYPKQTSKQRPIPSVIQNISKQKRKEKSIYKPSDLWTEEDDAIFLKYCPSKRMKCYHTVSRDTSCRPSELLKLSIKEVLFKMTSDNKQYAEIVINGKAGNRTIPLFHSIPYVKDYLDHEHPRPGNPDAGFFSGTKRRLGQTIRVGRLNCLYRDLKLDFFPKLLISIDVPVEDKQKIRGLLKKPWNPYVRRHTGLTEKSKKIPGLLTQYAGWTNDSKMPAKYLHYFANESSNSLLAAYGIVTTDNQQSDLLKPKQCPNCNEPNKPDSKFCAKCRMVLTYDAYNETVESHKEKEYEIQNLKDQMRLLEESQKEIIQCLKYPGKLAQIAKEA
jgi:integrase/recombinase XerD